MLFHSVANANPMSQIQSTWMLPWLEPGRPINPYCRSTRGLRFETTCFQALVLASAFANEMTQLQPEVLNILAGPFANATTLNSLFRQNCPHRPTRPSQADTKNPTVANQHSFCSDFPCYISTRARTCIFMDSESLTIHIVPLRPTKSY